MQHLKAATLASAWLLSVLATSPALAADYGIAYQVRVRPDAGIAAVTIEVDQKKPLLLELSASLQGDHWFDFEADGELALDDEQGFRWTPPATGGTLAFSTRIDRLRDDHDYDSRCMPSWMLTRAENLFPPMAARFESGTSASATLELDLPPSWQVVTPFERKGKRFIIEQSHRRVDQPKGWMIAGRLDRIEETIAGTRVLMAAPRSHDARLRDLLAFLRFVLPSLAEIAGEMPPRIVIVMADDPMWRGGLAGPASMFLHADRPFIDEDGTSPLIHELIHVITHARAIRGYDWLVEGLAEFYSLQVLQRSGAVSEETHTASLERLRARGRGVVAFDGESAGAETARAVTMMHELDRSIRQETKDEASLDDVLQALVAERTVLDRETFLELVERTSGVTEPVTNLLSRGPKVLLPEE
jgi:hypothetical protein